MMLPAVKFLGAELLPFVFVSLQEFGDVGEHGKADERAFAPFKILLALSLTAPRWQRGAHRPSC